MCRRRTGGDQCRQVLYLSQGPGSAADAYHVIAFLIAVKPAGENRAQLLSAANVANCPSKTLDKVCHPTMVAFGKIKGALPWSLVFQYLETTPHENLFRKGHFRSCSASGGSTRLSVTDGYQKGAVMPDLYNLRAVFVGRVTDQCRR